MTLQCVVLAGGMGTRMRPLTESMPKALIPVLGVPFVHWQLELLAGQGVREVVLCVGYRGRMLIDQIGDGSQFGLRVTWSDEGDELLGTGGAIRLALERGVLQEAFFVLYGDSYLPVSFAAVEDAWRKSRQPALMTVLRNEERWDRSNCIYQDGQVLLYDKSRPGDRRGDMRWIDYGLSVLTGPVVRERIPAHAMADLADVQRDLSVSGELAGLEVQGRFYEAGSPAGLRDLEEHLRGRRNPSPRDQDSSGRASAIWRSK